MAAFKVTYTVTVEMPDDDAQDPVELHISQDVIENELPEAWEVSTFRSRHERLD